MPAGLMNALDLETGIAQRGDLLACLLQRGAQRAEAVAAGVVRLCPASTEASSCFVVEGVFGVVSAHMAVGLPRGPATV